MQALILAGGSGKRFWPLSRRRRPKQFLALEGERTLLQTTFDRLRPLVEPAATWVCTTGELAGEVRRQLPEVPAAQVLGEPEGRNTAAAIGWAVRSMPAPLRGGVVAVLPADHRMADAEAFRRTLAAAARLTGERDEILTLGVTPTRPEPGYGHLELAETLEEASGLRRVARFTEKPDPETARRFFEGGGHLWNAGIFVFRGETLLAALAAHQPELAAGLEQIARQPDRLTELYPRLPAISIDHGVMEHAAGLAALPLDCGWSDLGSWLALWEALAEDGAADASGNVAGKVGRGRTLAEDCRDCLLIAADGVIAAVGLEGVVVVRAGDAVLVVPRERSQEVGRLVARLREEGLDGLL